MWAGFREPPLEKSPGERYWNAFGVGKPSGMVTIAFEINSPKVGPMRQVAGAYALSPEGNVHVVHRGIFTAGCKVPKSFTRSHFHWDWVQAQDPN